MKIIHKCKFCDNKFLEYKSNNRLFCSKKCYTDYLQICPNRPMLGKKHSEETKIKIGLLGLGRKATEETRKKLRKNNSKYWFGKKRSEETKEKIRLNAHVMRGEENPHWKGNNAGYVSLHKRIRTQIGKASKCENPNCKGISKAYQWANISGKYWDFKDYKQMCASCHKLYDNQKRQQRTSKARV